MIFRRIIDQRTGIVRRIEQRALHPHLPRELVCMVAQLADTTRFCVWPSDPTSTGCGWWDAEAAWNAALGEAVERYCGNLVPAGLLRASYADCIAAAYPALNPEQITLFSEEQYQRAGFPFTRLTHDLPIQWVVGRELQTGAERLVPASLVYVTYPRANGPTRAEPLINPPMVAGIAAGLSHVDAECAALEELIERDSVMVAWLTQTPLPRLQLPPDVAALMGGPAGVLETTAVLFPNPYNLPVLGAFVYDRLTGIVTLGTACRPGPHEALFKAYAEAAQLHMVADALNDPDSLWMQTAQQGHGPLKRWREDRAYLRHFCADWLDVTDLLCQLQLYLDPAMRQRLDAWLVPAPEIALDEIVALPDRSRDGYLERLLRTGISPIAVDVTTPDIAPLGLAVVRVVAPGLCVNTPAAFPLLAAPRLREIAAAFPNQAPPLPYA